jgi:hypothetical protein
MLVRRAPLVALACGLSGACGVGTAGLSGEIDAGDATAKQAADAEGAGEGSSAAPDAWTGQRDGHDLVESAADDASDGVASPADSQGRDMDASAEASDAGQIAIGDDSASTNDARDAAGPGDGGAPTDAPADTGIAADAESACGDAGSCFAVPVGWTVVAFAPTQAAACPPGFGQSADLVEGPDATNACGCGTCQVTTQPSCASGPIQVFFDNVSSADAGTCNLAGSVTPLGNSPAGTCLTDLYQGSYRLFDLEYVPSGPSGGACASPGAAALGNLTYAARDRTCTPSSAPPAGCNGMVCTATPAGPYTGCITAPGDVACPSGPLTARHLVGTDTSFDCAACACTVTGDCTGTVTLFSDTQCKGAPLAVPADGSCNMVRGLGTPAASYNSYSYQANAPTQVDCSASGSSSPESVALTNEATICCAP